MSAQAGISNIYLLWNVMRMSEKNCDEFEIINNAGIARLLLHEIIRLTHPGPRLSP